MVNEYDQVIYFKLISFTATVSTEKTWILSGTHHLLIVAVQLGPGSLSPRRHQSLSLTMTLMDAISPHCKLMLSFITALQ